MQGASLLVAAAVSDGTTTQTRHTWLPKATTAPEYDTDGNLTDDGQWTYLWDAEHRLVEMETTQAAVTAGRPYRKVTFAYDWTGRRLARNIHGPNSTLLSATRWLYDGWNPVAEFSAETTGQTLVRTYLWGVDMSGTMQGAGGVGGLLSVSLITNNFLPSYDGNGNIVAWTVSGSTAPACLREYDSFGNILVEHGTPPCQFGFSTKPEDPETRLLYYGHRYLNPLHGRWLSKDPIEEEGGLNLYGFVGNDGVGEWDYLGLDPGDDFLTHDAAFDNARWYVRKKANESLENAWKQFGEAVGIPTGTKADRDAMFDRMTETRHAARLKETSQSDMAIYQIGKLGQTNFFTVILGREKAANVYCYNRSGTSEYSYNFYEGAVADKNTVRERGFFGTLKREEILKLRGKKEHKGMPIVRHLEVIHSHNGLLGFEKVSVEGARPKRMGQGVGISNGDMGLANDLLVGTKIVATENDGRDYVFTPRVPGPEGSKSDFPEVVSPPSPILRSGSAP